MIHIKMKSYFLLFLGVALIGCKSKNKNPEPVVPIREHSVQSVLWHQKSTEYKALCYQSFNIARRYLNEAISNQIDSGKTLAIITDIDETVLDNSPFNAHIIHEDVEYTRDLWLDWGEREAATSVPGALEFYNYVASRKVEIFYISNRNVLQKAATISNLTKLGYPYADSTHVLLKDTTSKKQARRDIVLKDHQVLMYLGDNLSDFSSLFDGADRTENLDSIKDKLGFEFVMLPNVMYGSWETYEIYGGTYDWTDRQKDSIRKAHLRAY